MYYIKEESVKMWRVKGNWKLVEVFLSKSRKRGNNLQTLIMGCVFKRLFVDWVRIRFFDQFTNQVVVMKPNGETIPFTFSEEMDEAHIIEEE